MLTSRFTRNIRPAVEQELALAKTARQNQQAALEFVHLENAHVLGQESTYWHTRIHCAMLLWAIRNRKAGEFCGQLLRIVGAVTKTAMGWVPTGNTGGTNVSPFSPLPLKESHAQAIARARRRS